MVTGGLVFAASLAYGIVTYLTTFAAVPGPWVPATGIRAVVFDVLLFSVFALHHSLFAWAPLKQVVQQTVSSSLERSVYVWCASVLFAAMLWLWWPAPGTAWEIRGPLAAPFFVLQIAGVVLTMAASKRLGLMDLAGVAQVDNERHPRPRMLMQTGLYALVRHPIYLAWVLMVWPAPVMTGSRLVFAAVSTAYLVLAVPIEERRLVREFGPAYGAYQRQVRWRMVPFLY